MTLKNIRDAAAGSGDPALHWDRFGAPCVNVPAALWFLRTAFIKVMMPWFHNLAMLLAGALSSKNSGISAQPSSHNGDPRLARRTTEQEPNNRMTPLNT